MQMEREALAGLRREQGDEAVGLVEAALSALTGEDGLEAITALRLCEFLWDTLPTTWLVDDPERVTTALGRFFTLVGLDRYAGICTSATTGDLLVAYATEGTDAGRDAYRAALHETGLIPPDTGVLAWGDFSGAEESAAHHAASAAIELAIASGDLRVGARGWEKRRAAVVERHLTALRPGGSWLERVHAERLATWTRPRNRRRAELCRAVVSQLREPVIAVPGAFTLLRWLLDKAADGLPLTDRHYIVPRLVTEAVDLFGWRELLAGTLTREFDVFPLQSIRELATREMKAVRRTGKQLVLTPLGRRMLADETLLWNTAVSAVIGQGHAFTVTAREVMLMLLTVHGPMDAEDLERDTVEVLGQEWDTSGGLAQSVREELAVMRHRLWALDCHHPARSFDAPFALTSQGAAAVRAALRAHALRPRHTPGLD
ncbi:hypothetical protein [Streptosporangium subroseum]|uniref:hypothetical protein n=1 Tax=Streptosporangium subroseum TaxID=106412 RepID=UPI003087DDBD|nr:hypothetical protein OHB15_34810 [Streptosporangium subroseum]